LRNINILREKNEEAVTRCVRWCDLFHFHFSLTIKVFKKKKNKRNEKSRSKEQRGTAIVNCESTQDTRIVERERAIIKIKHTHFLIFTSHIFQHGSKAVAIKLKSSIGFGGAPVTLL
jgi:hypothetical protein